MRKRIKAMHWHPAVGTWLRRKKNERESALASLSPSFGLARCDMREQMYTVNVSLERRGGGFGLSWSVALNAVRGPARCIGARAIVNGSLKQASVRVENIFIIYADRFGWRMGIPAVELS